MKADNTLAAYRISLIEAVLAEGYLCAHDLAPKVFLCYAQTWRYLKALHGLRRIHIAKWKMRREARVYPVACFALGEGKDAKKPKRLTGQQRQARSRAKMRADADRYDLHLAKGRAAKRKPARDPLVEAMFGSAMPVEVRHGAH